MNIFIITGGALSEFAICAAKDRENRQALPQEEMPRSAEERDEYRPECDVRHWDWNDLEKILTNGQ